MDLEYSRLTEFENRALNRYLDLSGEDHGLPAMPLSIAARWRYPR